MDPLNVSTRDYKSSPRRLLSGMTSLGHLVATINQLWSCKAPKLEDLKPTRRPKTTPSPICNVCAVATPLAFPELATRTSSSNGEANTAKSLIEVSRVLVEVCSDAFESGRNQCRAFTPRLYAKSSLDRWTKSICHCIELDDAFATGPATVTMLSYNGWRMALVTMLLVSIFSQPQHHRTTSFQLPSNTLSCPGPLLYPPVTCTTSLALQSC